MCCIWWETRAVKSSMRCSAGWTSGRRWNGNPASLPPTTAVQAIDQIEDLLRRLGRRDLDAGFARDSGGTLRLVVPMPTWEDYLTLAFDEIRQFGMSSVQVMRRLRAALVGVAESTTIA